MRKITARGRPLLALTVVLVSGLFAVAPSVAWGQFGVASFSTTISTPQAGAHGDFSSTFLLNTDALGNPEGQLRNATFTLPQGLVGNPQAIERCSLEAFGRYECGSGAQVGEIDVIGAQCRGISSPLQASADVGATKLTVPNANAFCSEEGTNGSNTITVGTGASAEPEKIVSIINSTTLEVESPLLLSHPAGEPVTHIAKASSYDEVPLYNVQPSPGHLATFAASLVLADIFVEVDVGTDGRLTASINESATLLPIQGTKLTLWGVPAASSHDPLRCTELLQYECGPSHAAPAPFMTNPTTCAGPLETQLSVSSWQGQAASSTASLPQLTNCDQLTMAPTLAVTPGTTQRDVPSSYEVALKMPQEEEPYGLATPTLNEVTVTLPPGTSLSPGFANGLQTCAAASFSEGTCPSASRIGTAEVVSPLVSGDLKGGIYIGTPTPTEKYRVLLSVSSGDATVDLEGQADPNETTGQVTAVFTNVPQLPLSEFKLTFFGGPTAAFANPETCGPATSTSQVTSSAGQIASPSSTFVVDDNGEGGSCPPSQSFAPSFSAGTMSPLAGSFSPFTLTVSRSDGEPDLSTVDTQLPPGLIGLLGSVPICPSASASEDGCAPASAVGTATLVAGTGPLPLTRTGPVYLTGPYDGAPFGLAVVFNVTAGPFNLGTVTVRSRLYVDPTTLALSIVSDPLPQILGGIPLRLRTLNVNLGRPGFIINPTNCLSQSVTAVIGTALGTSTTVSTPFEVGGCAGLGFSPRLTSSTQANGSDHGNGASLAMTLSTPTGSTATMHSVVLDIPGQLRPRLATLQHACQMETVLASPTTCPADAVVGHATASTPVLPLPLNGSIYLVAHGGTAVPSLAMLLQGDGISFALDGELHISHTGTISTEFRGLPDIPIASLAISLPGGPHSILGAIDNLCAKPLNLPYNVSDQSGRNVKGTARVAVSGCPRHARTAKPKRKGRRGHRPTKSPSSRTKLHPKSRLRAA